MPPLLETLHVSRAGPWMRSAASYVIAPMWRRRGASPPAPPHIKRSIVTEYVRRSGVDTFVETGTYRGDTTEAIRPLVARACSIELDPRLAELARRRFERRSNVEIIQGDSADVLPRLVAELHQPALFWLDGHFSGGVTAYGETITPIESEVQTVLAEGLPDHVVLVDDARLFNGSDGYPTIDRVESLVRRLRPTWTFDVADDIIRVHSPAVAERQVVLN